MTQLQNQRYRADIEQIEIESDINIRDVQNIICTYLIYTFEISGFMIVSSIICGDIPVRETKLYFCIFYYAVNYIYGID